MTLEPRHRPLPSGFIQAFNSRVGSLVRVLYAQMYYLYISDTNFLVREKTKRRRQK